DGGDAPEDEQAEGGGLRPLHRAGEGVAPDLVLPEGVLADLERSAPGHHQGRAPAVDEFEVLVRAVFPPAGDRPHPDGGAGEQDDDDERPEPDHRACVAEGPCPDDLPLGFAFRFTHFDGAFATGGLQFRELRGHAFTRIRGSRAAQMRSATMLAMMARNATMMR